MGWQALVTFNLLNYYLLINGTIYYCPDYEKIKNPKPKQFNLLTNKKIRGKENKSNTMLKIQGSAIKLTRGDDAIFTIDVYQPDGSIYSPSEDQRILFSVSR